MADFVIPSFLEEKSLEEKSPEEIHKKMMDALPDDIDNSAGQYPYDLTYPAALVVGELAQYDMPRIMQQIWPQFASAEYLDYHAQTRNMSRKEAQYATGILTIEGDDGTKIPAGTVFATVSRNNSISIQFKTEKEYVISNGSIDADIVAVNAGATGNVNANTIILVISDNLGGIKAVYNAESTTGGYDEESDEALRDRITQYDRSMTGSFIGNEADYKRWAEAVTGVDKADVISAQDDTGLVTLVITDSNGDPASESICQAVYDYIMNGANELGTRLAPINANLKVIPVTTTTIAISASVKLKSGYVLADVKESFILSVKDYLQEAKADGEILYSRICNVLGDVEGVYDIKDVILNNGTANISLEQTLMPVVNDGSVSLVEEAV